MRNVFFLVLIFTSIFLCSCKESRPKLQIQEISSKEISIDFDKYLFPKGTFFYLINNNLYDFHIDISNKSLVGRSLNDSAEKFDYVIELENVEDLSSFNIVNDTIVLSYKSNDIILKSFEGWKENLNIVYDDSLYSNLRHPASRIIIENNLLFIPISSRVSNNFIDTFQSLVYDMNTKELNKICRYPIKFTGNQYHYRGAQQYKTKDNLFFVFEKCDSILWYEKNNLHREMQNYISIFTDLVRVADTPYDDAKARDTEYVVKYAFTTEVNVPVFQKQEDDQLYVIKRLYKEKRADKDQYVLGKIKDKKYVGYCYLPDDYNVAAQFINNDTLYYLSLLNDKTTWKGFKITER